MDQLPDMTGSFVVDFINHFHFIRPWWLLGILLALIVWQTIRRTSSTDALDELVDAHLQAAVIDSPQESKRAWRSYLLPMLLPVLLSISLAGPTWQRLPQPLYQLQQGRVVVLSLSKTMDRKDMKPSRLARAKFKINDMLTSLPGVLTGLVAFAGEAFLVSPLSDDQDTISNLLQSLDSDTLPVSGKRAERGLAKAAELLESVSIDAGELLLVTDQASPLAVSIAAGLAKKGMRVSVLEVSPPSKQSQSALLKSIAQSGRGVYSQITADELDLNRLNAPMKAWALRSQSEKNQSQRSADQWRDLGPWLLFPILLLSSLLFRRGWLANAALLIAFVSLSVPQPVMAADWRTNLSNTWQGLWQRDDQIQWQAAQAYQNQDWAAASEGFSKDDSAVGAYNRGNVQAMNQAYEEAIKSYDDALAMDPDLEAAQYNKGLVEAALAEQQEQQDQEGEGEEGEGDEGEGEKKEGEEGESDEGEGEEEGDSQDSKEGEEGETEEGQEGEQADGEEGQEQNGESESAEQAAESEEAKEGEEPVAEYEAMQLMGEEEQALEANLRQIPDNPGALLKRKFKYQYDNRQQQKRQ